MKIPFAIPLIDDKVINEVNDCLKNTGWITSGPKVKELEKKIKEYLKVDNVVCVNSWTSGAMLALKWYGIGPGDEVIIPSYTYAATALCVLNIGAKPIMVDVLDDFNINYKLIKDKINSKTKAIIPVDIGGLPCNYKELNKIINSEETKNVFSVKNNNQKLLGRPILISDSAHSFGAKYSSKFIGHQSDFTIFSFHSVKNLTTAEGGAVVNNLPIPFNQNETTKSLKLLTLNGQTKSSFDKSVGGSWKYDIVDQGLKINMPDICAAIGLAQISTYENVLLPERKHIFDKYNKFFSSFSWAEPPIKEDTIRESSCHLYMLRIKGITESQRDEIIEKMLSRGIGVNVHYIPLASLTLFKKLGYELKDYPNTYKLYSNQITLPLYNGLKNESIELICNTLKNIINELNIDGRIKNK